MKSKENDSKLLDIAGIRIKKKYKHRSLIIASILSIMLKEITRCELIYDKGLLLNPAEIEKNTKRT